MTTSPLANPSATREMLEAFGLATKHRLGQNFLIDNHVIERIMDLAELTGSERVLEVGPGIGTLTLALVQAAGRVISIEMDSELEPVLSAHAIDHPNFNFILGDALAVPPAQIAEALGGEPELLVANLPYNVAATIILQFFQTMPSLKRAVVMVQKRLPTVSPPLPAPRRTVPIRSNSPCMARSRAVLRCRRVALCPPRTWIRRLCASIAWASPARCRIVKLTLRAARMLRFRRRVLTAF